MKKNLVVILALMGMVLAAVPSFANITAVGASTVQSTLRVSVTVQDTIQLTLSTGTQCAITGVGGGADYNINFGTVDALGIATPLCGARYIPLIPGTSNAVYYSDYKLTTNFTSQPANTGTVTAYTTGFAKANLTIVQSNTTPAVIGDLAAMSVLPGTPSSVTTTAASGATITRYIGVSVAPTNGSVTYTGADVATVTYTLTVP